MSCAGGCRCWARLCGAGVHVRYDLVDQQLLGSALQLSTPPSVWVWSSVPSVLVVINF